MYNALVHNIVDCLQIVTDQWRNRLEELFYAWDRIEKKKLFQLLSYARNREKFYTNEWWLIGICASMTSIRNRPLFTDVCRTVALHSCTHTWLLIAWADDISWSGELIAGITCEGRDGTIGEITTRCCAIWGCVRITGDWWAYRWCSWEITCQEKTDLSVKGML